MPNTPGQEELAAHAVTAMPDTGPEGDRHDSGNWYGEDYDAEDDPLVGAVLSNTYEVVRILGEGGMGRVYEAQHTRIKTKRFAIKALHPEFARRKEVLVRFQREVEAAASIQSPHVVGVFDVDQTQDGQPFLVSELLEGSELGEYLEQNGAIPIGFAVNVVRQICKALHAAHEKGIIHRDMKPENVFLCGEIHDPVAKVLDFGISRLEGQDGNTLTKTGIIMGTPSYMAPEQAKGLKVDQRVDVYAVGAILYQAVTGKIPFDRSDATATLAAVLTEDPERPRAIMPTIPESVEMVIQRAMAREPEDRYASMAELDAALAPFDEREMMLSIPDKSARLSAVKVTQQSLLDASDHARQIADARPQLLLYSSLGVATILFALFTAISGGVRLFRDDDFPTLSGLEATIMAAILIAALATPAYLVLRNLLRTTWDNTAKVLEAVKLVRDPVLAGLAGYGLVAICLRMLETFVLRTQVGIAWPFWDLLLPLAGMITGATAWMIRRGASIRRLGTTVLMSVGCTLAVAAVVGGAFVRTPVEVAADEEDTERRKRSSKSSSEDEGDVDTTETKSAAPSPKARKLPEFESPLKAWESVSTSMSRGHWSKAIDSLEVFLQMDDEGHQDLNVRKGAEQLAVKACVNKAAEICTRMMTLLSEKMDEGGIDVLFELVVTRGGTGATWHAARLLQQEKVLKRGSEQLRIAHALRVANNCDKVRDLLGDAAKTGDRRAIRELKIISGPRRQCQARGCCMLASSPLIKTTIATIDARNR